VTVTSRAALSTEEIAQFWNVGYIVVRGALTAAEAERARRAALGLVPDDLCLPPAWHSWMGRIKPYDEAGSDMVDTPELLPLFANERLYAAAAQLLETPRLRVFDGSIGITLRNDAPSETERSQTLHIDASVPDDVDDFLGTLEELQVGGCYYLTDVERGGGGLHVVPGGHRIVAQEAAKVPGGRHLYANWRRIPPMDSVEVLGGAGDFVLCHHLMPHAASHNRRTTTRVAQFLRFVRTDHPHGAANLPARTYDDDQLAAISPLGRRLLGLDPWPDETSGDAT
jgi:ectoine hydroxylase-related dioxygenase (phytanoyl-CoA dioxygenase family)